MLEHRATDKSDLTNLQEVKFAEDNLKVYGKSILSLQPDKEFRKSFYSSIEESFDGERNVLFKTLLEIDKNPTNAKKLNDKILANSEDVLNAFNGIEGKNYYPQVFIPYYDELKDKGKLSTKPPTLVIYTHDSPNSLYQGYSLNDNGTLVELKTLISEDYAKENEVWVVSINERVDDKGDVYSEYKTNGRTLGASYPNAKFVTIKIDSHKEVWVSGGSEVHIKRYLSFYRYDQYSSSPAVLQVTSEDAFNDGDGWRITEVKRKDVGKTLTVNWTYVGDWPNKYYNFQDGSSYHTDYFYYVVFEYDPWPTGMRTASIPDLGLSGLFIPTNYRSADTYYNQSYIPEGGANYWTSTTGFHFTSQY